LKNNLRPKNEYTSLMGKTVAISGSTGGIGKELCASVASMGGSLLLLDRNPEKVGALISSLQKSYPSLSAKHILLDLESSETVRSAINELKKDPPSILVLSAGAYHVPRHKCSDGHDNIFKINFLSPYELACGLLPDIEKRGGKVIAVGSLAHLVSRFDPRDPECLNTRSSARAYGNAKRLLMFSLYRLCRGKDCLSVAHPGISPTGITGGYPKAVQVLIKYPMKLIFMSPRKASKCILHGIHCATDEGEWIGPRFFGIWGKPKKRVLRGYTTAEADAIVSYAERIK